MEETDSAKPSASGNASATLKEKSVRIMEEGFTAKELLDALVLDIGADNIVGCVKVSGQWIVTLKESRDAELLMETGVEISGQPYTIQGVTKNITTVSLFGVPSFIPDKDLTQKLSEFGCKIKSHWTRKTFPEFPNIENGIRFARLELPQNKKSLPYAIIINGVHLRLKHNGQEKVCNLCLSDDHIMKNCPLYKCKECDTQGHSESHCPTVLCYACKKHGHKSFACPEKDKPLIANTDNEAGIPSVPKDIPQATPTVSVHCNSPRSSQNSDFPSKSEDSIAPGPVTTDDPTDDVCAMEDSMQNVSNTDGSIKRNLSRGESEGDNENSQGFDVCTMEDSSQIVSNTDGPIKRNLSCGESEDDNENSQGFDRPWHSQPAPTRQRKHVKPNLSVARNFTPKQSLDHGKASTSVSS